MVLEPAPDLTPKSGLRLKSEVAILLSQFYPSSLYSNTWSVHVQYMLCGKPGNELRAARRLLRVRVAGVRSPSAISPALYSPPRLLPRSLTSPQRNSRLNALLDRLSPTLSLAIMPPGVANPLASQSAASASLREQTCLPHILARSGRSRRSPYSGPRAGSQGELSASLRASIEGRQLAPHGLLMHPHLAGLLGGAL